MHRPILTGALCACLAAASAAAAQGPTLNLSLTGANAYVWRGVTLADQTVLQGDASLSLPVSGFTVTAGAWGNAELDPDSTRFSSLTGFEPGVGEVDLYAQVAHPWGPATVALGITALRFPEIEEWNTFEVFGSVAFPGAPLAPTLVVRRDVDAVGGAYAELGLSHAVALAGGRSLALAGVAGATTGQDDDGDLAWYADEGLTHLGASASMSFAAGGFSITPQVSLVYGIDDFAKVNGEAARLGAALTISRSLPLGR